jgi:hypothetical protein
MQPVIRVAVFQHSLAVHQGRIVIRKNGVNLCGVALDPGVQFQNLCRRATHGLRVRGVVADRSEGTEDHFDLVRLCQLGDGLKILLDHLCRFGACISGDVVGSGQQNHGGRLQVDNVRHHPNQHLGCGLAADAAVDVRLAGKEFLQVPSVGDGIAKKGHPPGHARLRLQTQVVLVVTAKLVPVLEFASQPFGGMREAAAGLGRIEILYELGAQVGAQPE